MLELQNINTYYGESHILRELSMGVERGNVVTLLGRNGAGKTTTLKTVMGILRSRSGRITLNGNEISNSKPYQIARRGVGYVPEERRIFPSLSVLENLTLPLWGIGNEGWELDRIYHFFPRLKARQNNKGAQLSGGEQQMLAIARILRARIDLILLDEPTEGLAPILIMSIKEILEEIKRIGLTVLLIEQNTKFASAVADRHYILHVGKIVYSGSNDDFKKDRETQKKYLGV